MTLAHLVYIPGALLLGVTLGYILGVRAARSELARQKKRAAR
jgi:proteasome assembly chaperone (PAC2) family protein